MAFEIRPIESPTETDRESVCVHLRSHNQTSNPIAWATRDLPENGPKPIHLLAHNNEREIISGLFASTGFAWLPIDIMATAVAHRGQGIGRALLQHAESRR